MSKKIIKNIKAKSLKVLKDPLNLKKKKIGLALGSGGAKGFAHIGVLKVLEREGIRIDMVAGSSVGAIIGAFYGAYHNAKELEIIANEFKFNKIFDVGIPRSGIAKGDKLEAYFRKKLNNLKFEELPFKLFVCTTDIMENREIIFNSGDLAKAVRASASLPGLFYPVENKGKILVDGGLKNPLPVDILKENGCDIVIAVNLDKECEKEKSYERATKNSSKNKLPNLQEISTRTHEIVEREIIHYNQSLKNADVLIAPEVSAKDLLNFKKTKEFIKEGEVAATKKIKKIKRLSRRIVGKYE